MKKKAIFGESKEIWERKKREWHEKLEKELELEKKLPKQRELGIMGALYYMECILKEFGRKEVS